MPPPWPPPPVPEPTVASRASRVEQRSVGLPALLEREPTVALGFSSDAIRRLVQSGYLHPIHRGVYHVGHPAPTRLGLHHAATLAFGKRTAVSHRPATVLGGLLADRGARIEVTTASGDSGVHHGVLVHESRRLRSTDVLRFHGIPTVRLEWALVDVAGAAPGQFPELFNALDRKRLVDPLLLAGQLRRGRKGSALVRARLQTWTATPPTESELEELLEAPRARRRAPHAHPPGPPAPRAPDARRLRLARTARRRRGGRPGMARHPGRVGRGPRARSRPAHGGLTPLRYTHRQLTQTPQLVLADLANALGSPA